jgi:hypothetical protein
LFTQGTANTTYALITGLQLEKGSVATAFEQRPLAQEQQLVAAGYVPPMYGKGGVSCTGNATVAGSVTAASVTAGSVTCTGNVTFSGVATATRLGVGTTTPSSTYALDVDGNIHATGDITAFSDIRKKSNLQRIENALDKIDQVSGYTFDVVDSARKHTGVIAQEMERVLPEVIYEDEADGMKSVAYGNIVGLLIEGIKELKAEFIEGINALKAKVKVLEDAQQVV